MKAIDPEATIILNIRAILAVMRGAGVDVRRIDVPKQKADKGWFSGWGSGQEVEKDESEDEDEEPDRILTGAGNSEEVEGTGGRWFEIPLVF
jgi:hypothetical protein